MLQLSSLAVFFAFITLLMALPAIFNPRGFRKGALKMLGKVSNMRLLALFNLIIAYLVLEANANVGKNWESVMSVLGYLLLVRGIVWFWWPESVKKVVKKFAKNNNGPVIMGLIALIIGLFFGYLGFYVY